MAGKEHESSLSQREGRHEDTRQADIAGIGKSTRREREAQIARDMDRQRRASLSQEALRERHELSKVTSSERRALQRKGDIDKKDAQRESPDRETRNTIHPERFVKVDFPKADKEHARKHREPTAAHKRHDTGKLTEASLDHDIFWDIQDSKAGRNTIHPERFVKVDFPKADKERARKRRALASKGDIGKKDAQSDDDGFSKRLEKSKGHNGLYDERKLSPRDAVRMHREASHYAAGLEDAMKQRHKSSADYKDEKNYHEGAAKDIAGMELDAQSDDDRAHTQRESPAELAQRNESPRNAIARHRNIAKAMRLGPRAESLQRAIKHHEGAAKDIEGMELDAQEKGDPWSDQNTRHDTDAQRDDDLDPERIKRDLDDDRHEAADRAVEKSIERHAAKRSDEEPNMADHDDLKGRIQALHDELDELESQLHGGDEPEGDEPEGDEPEGDEPEGDEPEGDEPEGDEPSEDRSGEDEHDAGEELAEGHEDVEHGDKAEGEELEHEAGEAEAEDRDHGDDDDDDVREHRGDQAPEDVAESVTEADAQSSRRSVGVKRSFNNRHDSNEDNDMTQRSDEDIRRRIDVLDARLKRATRSASYKERDELSRIRARCDSVAQALGVRPEAPLPGEFPDEYRRRCAALLQPFSQSTKGVSIGRLDDAAFKVVEDRIYADAQSAAREPIKSLAGRLVPVESHDAAGRTITKYYGDPKAWMRPYMAPGVHIRFADSATRRNTGAR